MVIRQKVLGRTVLLIGGLGLFLAGFSPLADRLMAGLEGRFPKWSATGQRVDGVVVLGGALNVWSSAAFDTLSLNGSGARLVAMADLARRYPDAKIVFTGGAGAMFGPKISEADIIERHVADLGLAPGRVIFERESRNTTENAEFTRKLVNPKPGEHWLLVTSAFHMPRSMGMFRKAGFEVEAYPVGWMAAPGYDGGFLSISASDRMVTLDVAVREIVGLIAARLFNLSDELFPAP